MPKIVPQNMKAISSLSLQPQNDSSKIHLMVMMDIAGATTTQISGAVGLTLGRVSVIKTSPLFTRLRDTKRRELESQITGKKSDQIVSGDPIEIKLKALALDAVNTYERLVMGAQSESVQLGAANGIMDRAGYKSHAEKTKISVEVTERMADRFEKVLGFNKKDVEVMSGLSKDDRQTKVTIETEVSK